MSEKAKRTAKEITIEYQQQALRAGSLQYEIVQKTKDLAMLNDDMRNLSLEYVATKEAEETEYAREKHKEETESSNEAS